MARLIDADSLRLWGAFVLLALAAVAARSMVPWLIENEMVYLLDGRRLLDPDFLAADWTFGDRLYPRSLVYAPLTALLWSAASDPVHVAVVGRVLGWVFVLVGVARLARRLSLSPAVTVLGLLGYLATGQSLAAGEWIFGGTEQKVFAYGFVLFGLDALLGRRAIPAAVCAGMAVYAHVLVGGYGMLGLGAAAVHLRLRSLWRTSELLRFAVFAAAVAAPAVYLAAAQSGLGGAAPEGGEGAIDIDRVSVTFRNPHHLDPWFFFSWGRAVLAAACVALLAWALRTRAHARDAHGLIAVFLGVLAAVFGAGLLFRGCGWFGLLKFYPFRVADTLLPLFCWLLATAGGIEWLRARFERGWRWFLGPGALALLVVTITAGVPTTAHWYWVLDGVDYSKGTAPVTGWLRTNTARTDVCVVNPFWKDFWIRAERPCVVHWKSAPVNHRLVEWLARLRLHNNGAELTGVGARVGDAVEGNFRRLDRARLRVLRDRFDARFYIVDRPRPDLAHAERYADGKYHVYDLKPL